MTIAEDFDFRGQVTFLPTANLAQVIDFYEGLFGLEMVFDSGTCRIYKTGTESYLGFCDRGYAIPTDFRVVITLLIDDVDGVYERLTELGRETEGAPEFSERLRVYGFFVRDPNGYLVEVERFETRLP